MTSRIEKIVVVGGDLAAWIVAAALAKGLTGQQTQVTVVEREYQLDRFADNAAASILLFLHYLNIDERDFVRETSASLNLGAAYEDWSTAGQDFIHAFGAYGSMFERVEFQHFATKAHLAGDASPFDAYSVGAMAARLGRFAHPIAKQDSVLGQIPYSLSVDNEKARRYLKAYALSKGVSHVDADVVSTATHATSGNIESLSLSNGDTVSGEFFFDCSGREGRLIDECLGVSMIDWSHWLPYDRRVSVRQANTSPTPPHTTLQRLDEGWIRVIPLRDSVVAELHYQSDITSAASATSVSRDAAGAGGEHDVLHASIEHGCRKKFWSKNCVAIGAAAGDIGDFVINRHHLAQSAILRWLDHYPTKDCLSALATDYNRACHSEYARILDAHVLHFASASPGTSRFWQNAGQVALPESLQHKLDLFRSRGNFAFYEAETLLPQSWISLLIGLGYWPERYDPLADEATDRQVQDMLANIRVQIREAVLQLPDYYEYWTHYCERHARK